MTWFTQTVCVPRYLLVSWFVVLAVGVGYIWRTALESHRTNKVAADTIRAIDAAVAMNTVAVNAIKIQTARLDAARSTIALLLAQIAKEE